MYVSGCRAVTLPSSARVARKERGHELHLQQRRRFGCSHELHWSETADGAEEVDDEGASATATATATTLQEKRRARPNDDVKDASSSSGTTTTTTTTATTTTTTTTRSSGRAVVAAVIRCWACASRGGRRWGHCGSSPCGPTRRRAPQPLHELLRQAAALVPPGLQGALLLRFLRDPVRLSSPASAHPPSRRKTQPRRRPRPRPRTMLLLLLLLLLL